LVVGNPEAAATGIYDFIHCDEHRLHEELKRGTGCVVDEWERARSTGWATETDLENLRYILDTPAGSSDEKFQYGWKRDRAEDGSSLPSRTNGDGTGMRLADFANGAFAQRAGLTASQVLALRLYTTSAFRSINNPLRRLQQSEVGDAASAQPTRKLATTELAHPLPCTVVLIYEGLKRLRAVTNEPQNAHERNSRLSEGTTITPFDGIEDAELLLRKAPRLWERMMRSAVSVGSAARDSLFQRASASLQPTQARHQMVLWRGLKNISATKSFMLLGGSELAPCSTTPDIEIAIRYARDWTADEDQGGRALIFRVLVDDFMNQGPDLKWLSCFPHESEALYPPLTFFKPVGEPERLMYDGSEFTIVDVKPTFPS
jgi:hypothetical protein